MKDDFWAAVGALFLVGTCMGLGALVYWSQHDHQEEFSTWKMVEPDGKINAIKQRQEELTNAFLVFKCENINGKIEVFSADTRFCVKGPMECFIHNEEHA